MLLLNRTYQQLPLQNAKMENKEINKQFTIH